MFIAPIVMQISTKPIKCGINLWNIQFYLIWYPTHGEMRFRSNIILNIPQYYFHMAAILKNGCHFFPAECRQGSPPRSCAGRFPEYIDTQHVFTTAHVR